MNSNVENRSLTRYPAYISTVASADGAAQTDVPVIDIRRFPREPVSNEDGLLRLRRQIEFVYEARTRRSISLRRIHDEGGAILQVNVRPVLHDSRRTVATKVIVEREVWRPHVVYNRQDKRLHISSGLEEADYRVYAHTNDKAADRSDDVSCQRVVGRGNSKLGKNEAAERPTEQGQPSECLRERIVNRVPKPTAHEQPRSLTVHPAFPEISQSRSQRIRRVLRFHQPPDSGSRRLNIQMRQ